LTDPSTDHGEADALAELVEAERYLAEARRLRELGEQVARNVRARLATFERDSADLDRCVVDAERLGGELRKARLRAVHHLDQSGA
jgi:broad specificity phosphatase PhoE